MPITQPRHRPRTAPSRATAQSATGDAMADLCEVVCVDLEKVQRVRATSPAGPTLAALAETFRALGDPTRLRIVAALAQEELCVCDLARLVAVSESAVSHSLRTLRQLRLVRCRKVGKIAYYSLDDAHVARLVADGLGHVREAAVPPRSGVATHNDGVGIGAPSPMTHPSRRSA